MSLQLKGKVKVIFATETFPSGFQKREFVITTEEQYPQDVKFEVVKDKCATLDKYAVGQEVTVSFNVRGNEYQGKYFVNLQAWKIEAAPVAAAPVADQGEDDELVF
jgi:hypothetical protein